MVNHPNRSKTVSTVVIAVLAHRSRDIFDKACDLAKDVRSKGASEAMSDEVIADLILAGTALTDLAAVLMHDRRIHAQRAELEKLRSST